VKSTHKIIGRTRKGRPVYQIAGGSDSGVTVSDAPPSGDQPGEHRGEEPPATPAPTSQVDPGSFNRGFQEQQEAGNVPTPGQTQNPATGRVFTEAEVEAIRREEKDKVYGRLDEVQTELRTLREAREAEQRERDEEEARRVEAQRNEEEENLDVRELLRRKEEEWTQRFTSIEEENRKKDAMLEQERKFNALQEYKRNQLAVNEDNIMPQLRQYVQGSTEEEIDASIQQQISVTNEILGEMQAAQQQANQQVQTTRVTAPGDSGPLEQATANTRNYSAEEIAAMGPAEYAKHRASLLPAAHRQGPYAR